MAITIDARTEPFVIVGDYSVKRVITPDDQKVFKVTDEDLKTLMVSRKWERPDKTWVCPPTKGSGHDDKFAYHKWTCLHTNLFFAHGKVVEKSEVPEIVQEARMKNSSTTTKSTCTVEISATVTETFSHSQSKEHSVTIGAEAKLQFRILSLGGSFEYSHTWGETKTYSNSVTLGTKAAVSVTLEPGQGAVAKLVSMRGMAKVELSYSAYLDGGFIYYYNDRTSPPGKTDDAHRVWYTTLPKEDKEIHEIVTIKSYGRTEIQIFDEQTNALLQTIPLDLAALPVPGE